MEPSRCRNHHFITDGDGLPQRRILDVSDTDAVAVLLDGGICLELVNLLCRAWPAPMVVRLDPPVHLDGGAVPGAHLDPARSGGHFKLYGPGHVKGAVERAFRPERQTWQSCHGGAQQRRSEK